MKFGIGGTALACLFAASVAMFTGLPPDWATPVAHAEGQQITAYKLSLAEEASEDEALSAFYRDRDYAPVWTGEGQAERREALLTALSDAAAHGLPETRHDAEALVAAFRAVATERERGALEARMSRAFLRYARDISSGVLEPGSVDQEIKREAPRPDRRSLLEGFIRSKPRAFLQDLIPDTPEYGRLFAALRDIEARIEQGGWGPRVRSGTLRPGDEGPDVVTLRNRLVRMGHLRRTPSREYDAALEAAVRRYQARQGLEGDGVAGGATLEAINTSAEARRRAVVVAMERERWLNFDRGARHIWVNLTDFTSRIYDDGEITLETRAIIGQRRHQTPEFSEQMTYMEVNPDWTVPRSIVGNEYLPGLRQDRYAHSHLQVVDARGNVVDRGRVNFSQYSIRTFPFNLRQPPGPGNALGRVKFMFPNPYAIYLHDTPHKSLFNTQVRTHSHGCVRLNDPMEFAYELLRPQSADPQGQFHTTLNSGRQTRINLETPVPVHLVYRTAFTGAQGEMHYRDDVYGRDAAIFEALQRAGVALPDVQS